MVFSLIVHHEGSIVTEPVIHYVGGDVNIVHGVDLDKWSFFEAIDIVREDFGDGGTVKLWWKGDDDVLKEFKLDTQAMEMVNYVHMVQLICM